MAGPVSPRASGTEPALGGLDRGSADFTIQSDPTHPVAAAEVQALVACTSRDQLGDDYGVAMGSPPPFRAPPGTWSQPRSLNDALDAELDTLATERILHGVRSV
jgi:hypothetical protein